MTQLLGYGILKGAGGGLKMEKLSELDGLVKIAEINKRIEIWSLIEIILERHTEDHAKLEPDAYF